MISHSMNQEKPFQVRLIAHLELSVATYAPQYAFGPNYYCEPGLELEYQTELAALALQAARAGLMPGRLGLEYAESPIARGKVRSDYTSVYHGSPHLNIGRIEPQQATWHTLDPAKSYKFSDGNPTICTSPNTKFPAMRAILHSAHPELANHQMLLAKGVDRNGRTSWFTSEEALTTVQAEGTSGGVYMLFLQEKLEAQEEPPLYDVNRNEHRIYGPRKPYIVVPVDASTLPPDLCVIPAAQSVNLPALREYKHVLEWNDALRIDAWPLGGLWPKEYAL